MPKITGGGIRSRVVSETRAVKTEPRSYPVDAGRAADIGMSVHYQKMPLQGAGYSTPQGPNHNFEAGPGGGRVVMPSGSQSKTPTVTDAPRGKPHW